MNKYFLVIARYEGEKQEIFDNYISPINQRYCDKHGFDYVVIGNETSLDLVRDNPTWWKFTIVQDWIKTGKVKQGDVVTHFDADMVIVKDDKPYQTDKSFSYAIDNGNTHCMGNYTITVNDWSVNLIDRILDESLFQKLKDTEHWQNFREQAAWYTLSGILPHSWISFFDMPNYGFHSTTSPYLHYSLEDLEKHVEVRGPEWDTTLLAEEAADPVSKALQKYNIVKSRKEDTIVRHFAGRQPWNEEYFKLNQ
ncbi:MAG TPA: hypothetical protein EYN67_17180 [Flavobacteriales bacterium]|nr:hypothetical protein [Flavobacteriales bacterium]